MGKTRRRRVYREGHKLKQATDYTAASKAKTKPVASPDVELAKKAKKKGRGELRWS